MAKMNSWAKTMDTWWSIVCFEDPLFLSSSVLFLSSYCLACTNLCCLDKNNLYIDIASPGSGDTKSIKWCFSLACLFDFWHAYNWVQSEIINPSAKKKRKRA